MSRYQHLEEQFDKLKLETEITSLNNKVARLETFFATVVDLTLNHDVIADQAVVTAAALGEALEKVDPEWWRVKREEN